MQLPFPAVLRPPRPQLEDSLQGSLGSRYRICRELFGGGMSRLFIAYEAALDREVVVKVLPPDLRSATSVARFRREIQVTAQLQHPHILPVIASGDERLLYYVVPYVAMGSLRQRLVASGRLPLADVTRITLQLLSALTFAHEQGVVHRDIKPGNVLLSEGHAILADFGIAHAIEAMSDDAGLGSVAPPASYRAPERPTNEAADLYALAVMTFEMLTGWLPAPGLCAHDILTYLPDPGLIGPRELRHTMARVLEVALSRDPAMRFNTARQIRAALLSPFGLAGA